MEVHAKAGRAIALFQLCAGILLHLLSFIPGIPLVTLAAGLLAASSFVVCISYTTFLQFYAGAVFFPPTPIQWKGFFATIAEGNSYREELRHKVKELIPQRVRDVYFLVCVYCFFSPVICLLFWIVCWTPSPADNGGQMLRLESVLNSSPFAGILTAFSNVFSLTSLIAAGIVYPKLAQILANQKADPPAKPH